MRTIGRFISGFFKWTWRLLNFIREFILNLFLILLILVGVGIWMQVKSTPAERRPPAGGQSRPAYC